MDKQWLSKNPFDKAILDEGWEVIEIKTGVKQILIEKEKKDKENGKTKDNRNVSKQ